MCYYSSAGTELVLHPRTDILSSTGIKPNYKANRKKEKSHEKNPFTMGSFIVRSFQMREASEIEICSNLNAQGHHFSLQRN